jgi:hypothetical protein
VGEVGREGAPLLPGAGDQDAGHHRLRDLMAPPGTRHSGYFSAQRGHVDHEHLGRVEAQQRIGCVVIIRTDGAHAAVDRFGRQVQVLADVAGIQVQVAVAAFRIAPDGAVGHGCPNEGHRAGGTWRCPRQASVSCLVEVRIQPQGHQLMRAGHKAVQPGFQPLTRLTDR